MKQMFEKQGAFPLANWPCYSIGDARFDEISG
jgi:hypothetical protein